jgi:hypothetical protein
MYDASVPTLLHTLESLKAIMQKAVKHAETKKFDPNVLVGVRLAPDMLPFSKQIQIASDAAKFGAARLTGTDAPKFEDNETTMDELIARVEKTIAYLRGVDAKSFEGAEERSVTITVPTRSFSFPGLTYLRHWVLPNFFFHVSMAYALLRHNGVDLGKPDYLGNVV